MNRPDTVLVTGATGTTGSRVADRLAAQGAAVRAASRAPVPGTRHPQVRFDWNDTGTHGAALQDTSALYLVPPVGAPDPAAVMVPFLERARAAGVRRAVLLSSSALPEGGPAAGAVHAVLGDLFEEWAVLRPSWFMQNFTGRHTHAETVRASGVIRTATGDGRVGFVDAEDIAAVAVRALTDEEAPRTDLVLTGPEALSYDDIAAVLTRFSGRAVRHDHLTYEAMRDRLAAEGVPAEFAALLAGMDRSIADGAEDRVTGTVEAVTGRPPRSFATHVRDHVRDNAADR
ncbi:NAD(P)H-binding protein [Streptomyces iconiensis]|uniref:NAD(P)H-binding protein n=1 Tax=Streptomyces iconiensis TaxID=1384038 RepID=A0ABT7A3H0_9ACTN|nr:NAD(P)H-binding protein [Streptomyces iconiensis]MDJ1135850.1 NAD(P)H-binding protein [Streptomyces iconiensis]